MTARLATWPRHLARVAASGQRWPEFATNEKTPRRGERGAFGRKPAWVLPVGGELAALGLLEPGGAKHQAQKQAVLRMEFRKFLGAFIKVPCQIVRAGRRLIYRVLSYNPHLPAFIRLCRVLRC